MVDELELQLASEPEAEPDQSALMTLAGEVEAGNASAEDLADLAEEVEEKSWFAQFLDDIQEKGFLGAIFSLFMSQSNTESTPETNEPEQNLRVINSNPYNISPEELVGFNQNEQQYLRTIAQAGIKPSSALELYEQTDSPGATREEFFNYMAITVEACAHFEVSPDRMFPLIMATMYKESNFNRNCLNDDTHATGLMQHMPRHWDERSEDLIDAGVCTEPPDIWDPRAQIFASVDYYRRKFSSISDDLNNYPPETFARDIYLTYNCGGAHAWLVRIGALDWTNEQVTQLYNMPVSERVAQYGESARIFNDYAIRRLTRPRSQRSFDQVQAKYNEYRNILYGNTQAIA